MKRKLRLRFIIVSTLISFVVLGLIVLFINLSNYKAFVKSENDHLKEFIDRSRDMDLDEIRELIRGSDDIQVIDYAEDLREALKDKEDKRLSEIINEISDSHNVEGTHKDHRFYNDKAKKVIYLLNTQKGYDYYRSTLNNSIIVLILAMMFIFIISYLLSTYAVKPIVKNQEKQKKFITDASHELRTPLTIINSNVELLEYDLKDNKYINNIKSASNRLNSLVSELLSLAKLDENKKRTNEKFDFSTISKEMVEKYEDILLKKNCKLSSEIEEGIICNSNKEDYTKIIDILMENLSKYSTSNTEVVFKLYRKANNLFIETINEAENLEKREYKEIFDRFTRLDSHRNKKSGGSGIGLSILKSIVESYNGKVRATSDGNTLRIIIQLKL